jgi:hypothetical protein
MPVLSCFRLNYPVLLAWGKSRCRSVLLGDTAAGFSSLSKVPSGYFSVIGSSPHHADLDRAHLAAFQFSLGIIENSGGGVLRY